MIVYLSYPISAGLPSFDKILALSRALRIADVRILDPGRHNLPENVPKLGKIVVQRALEDIDNCDMVISLYERPSVGQSMEWFYAHSQGKPILLITEVPEYEWSYWLRQYTSACVRDIDGVNKVISKCLSIHQDDFWNRTCEELADLPWFLVIE